MDPVLIAAGLGSVIGLVMALTGAGGGILAIPLLTFGLHLPVQQAAPAGLLAVGLAAALGAGLGLRDGIVRYRAALLIGVAGMALAPLGVAAAQRLPNTPLLLAFAGVLVYSALRMLQKPEGSPPAPAELPCRIEEGNAQLTWTRRCARALAGTGMVSGFLSGLLGVGGGFVIVPALTRHTNMGVSTVQATSLAVIALVSISGVAAAALQGAIPWGIGIPFAAGAVGGLLAGRQLAKGLDPTMLQRAFAWLALLVALLMLARALG